MPTNTVCSAKGNRPEDMPEFPCLYFSVLPHHLTQNFVRVFGADGRVNVLHASHSKVEFYFHMVMEEYGDRRPGYYRRIYNYLEMVLMEPIRDHHDRGIAGGRTTARHPGPVPSMATSYTAGSLNQTIRVEELSRICGVSETYLYRLFKSTLSLSPQGYTLSCKVEYSARLLCNSHMIVTRIARELASSSSNHFLSNLYRIIGIRPTAYHKDDQPDS